MLRRTFIAALQISPVLSAGLSAALPATGHAQGKYPSKPITIIVPYGPGGTNDILARSVASKMATSIGTPLVVENRPGAGGNIGSAFVARSAADGYTVLMANSGVLTINKELYANPGYDPERDFTPITLAGKLPNVLLVSPTVPVKNVAELIRYARENPTKISYASMGTGTSGHLCGEMFKMLTGLAVPHVPYKGSASALTDLVGGHVQFMFDNLPTALPMAKSGRLNAFAVTSLERSQSLPDVPTMIEAGVKGFDATAWFGFVAPAATPKPVIERLHAEMASALSDSTVAENLASQGVSIVASSPQEFQRFIVAESARWKPVIQKSGMRAD